MNILILAWRDIKHPLAGGAERVMNKHAQAWARAGYKVTIFTSSYPGSKNDDTIKGVKTVRRGYEILGVHLAAVFWYLFGNHPDFDLVVDQFHGIPFFTPWFVGTKKLAVIQEVAKEVWLLNHLPFPMNKIVGVIGYLVEPLIYLFYKKTPFMTASKSAKEDLINFGIPEKNITIVQHGLTVPLKLKIVPKERVKTVMYLGALTRDKGIKDAIEVFSRLSKKDSSLQFWVVGKGGGSYLEFIKSKVVQFGLEEKIKFWGFVSERKKFELLVRAHVLINPSIREGWGLTVTEGSYVGTSTVGYNVAGLKDSIKPGVNGYLAPVKNVRKMEALVLEILRKPALLKKLSSRAKEHAREFTWEKSNKISLSMINKLLLTFNILVLNWKDTKHPEGGGAEQATLEHAKAWQESGHRVTWFVSSFSGGKRDEMIDGIKVIRSGAQVLGVQIAAFWWYLFGNHESFDLVIDQFHGVPFFTPIYVRTKKLAYIHEVAKEVWGLNPWPKPLNLIPALIGQILEPWIFRIFYKKIPFLTVSESTRRDLMEWGINKNNVSVIYNGVNLQASKGVSEKHDKKTVVFLGALSRDKGIKDAIKAFSYLNKIDSDWKFWIVGRGDTKFKNKLVKQCEILGISKNVKFWGYVDDKKKFELLGNAYVLINPSVREGWGLVNIEANGVGTPIIAYDVPGIKDSVINGRTGILVFNGDYKSLASSVLDLSMEPERYKRLQAGSKLWASKFSWEKSTRKSLKLVEQVVLN